MVKGTQFRPFKSRHVKRYQEPRKSSVSGHLRHQSLPEAAPMPSSNGDEPIRRGGAYRTTTARLSDGLGLQSGRRDTTRTLRGRTGSCSTDVCVRVVTDDGYRHGVRTTHRSHHLVNMGYNYTNQLLTTRTYTTLLHGEHILNAWLQRDLVQ